MLNEIVNIPKTFYSSFFYRDLVHKFKGTGFLFILILSLIGLIPLAFSQNNLFDFKQLGINNIAEQLPALVIKNNKASIDRPSPYSFKTLNQKIVLFDTSFEDKNYDAIRTKFINENLLVFVSENFLAFQKNKDELSLLTFDNDMTFTHEDWKHYADIIQSWGPPVFFLILTLSVIFYNYVITLIKSFLIKLCSKFFKYKIDFSAAMRLAAATAIPAAIIDFIIFKIISLLVESKLLSETSSNYTIYIGFILWLGFAFFGLRSAFNSETTKSKSKQPTI